MVYDRHLENWILNFLSRPYPEFGDLSPCPFAKKAYLDNKVKFLKVTNYFSEIRNFLNGWADQYDVLVFICPDNVPAEEFVLNTQILNNEFMPQNLVLLEDHKDVPEKIGTITLNNGLYNLILAQKLDKLNDAAHKLSYTEYSKKWPKDYYDQVVSWRLL